MTKPLVLAGWYVDVAYLKKAGIARIQVEIPMDVWESHQDVLGIPPAFDAAKKFVALTRLTETAFKKWVAEQSSAPQGADTSTEPDSGLPVVPSESAGEGQDTRRTPFKDKLRSQQAGIKLSDEGFKDWLLDNYGDLHNTDTYDALLKAVLGISSKTELDTNPEKAAAWSALLTDFDNKDRVR